MFLFFYPFRSTVVPLPFCLFMIEYILYYIFVCSTIIPTLMFHDLKIYFLKKMGFLKIV